jgi:glycosyltransferase involved in cell wall biosynthesis
MEDTSTPRLGRASTVLALVPHFNGERWLADCLESLVCQTRPLDGIAVVDDASPEPPVEIVRRFPQVTVLAAPENVGPYRLIQAAIDQTDHDAYLFQDADDWSTPDRLELLLAEAERSGAELIGTQGIRIVCDEGEAVPYTFPLDVNAALTLRPTSNPLHHPTSLVARDLVVRLGGFATGLRFSGDTEFLRRAAHVARTVNISRFCYFYRTHGQSLTGHPDTGLSSAARRKVMRAQHERARQNAERVARGEPPLLAPMAVAEPIRLHHLAGPCLCDSGGTAWPT